MPIFNVFSFLSHDGSPSATSDDLLPHRITLRISWLKLQEVEVDLVAEEVKGVEDVEAHAVEVAKTKKRSGKQTFPSGIIT
jgi:hypothetical protein